MIAIVNYGSGNVRAIANIYERLGVSWTMATQPEHVERAERIVLPGVGAFDHAMGELERSGLRPALDHAVLASKKPVLGICVGMQMLAPASDEGVLRGLGWIDGAVRRFAPRSSPVVTCLPHMGWNSVVPVRRSELLAHIDVESGFYFLHSYYFETCDPSDTLAETEYGDVFACAVQRGNIFGVQFHPEKSHTSGIRLLENFARLGGTA